MIQMKDCRISEVEASRVLMKNVNDRPNALAAYGIAKQTGNDMKDMFDRQFRMLQEKHNALCGEVEALNQRLNEAMESANSAVNSALVSARRAEAYATEAVEAMRAAIAAAETAESTRQALEAAQADYKPEGEEAI